MEEIVYGTSVTPQEYNQLRMAVGWYELTQRQALSLIHISEPTRH